LIDPSISQGATTRSRRKATRKGRGLPTAMWCLRFDPLTALRPTPQRPHVGS
jgi:hypothetical protein